MNVFKLLNNNYYPWVIRSQIRLPSPTQVTESCVGAPVFVALVMRTQVTLVRTWYHYNAPLIDELTFLPITVPHSTTFDTLFCFFGRTKHSSVMVLVCPSVYYSIVNKLYSIDFGHTNLPSMHLRFTYQVETYRPNYFVFIFHTLLGWLLFE